MNIYGHLLFLLYVAEKRILAEKIHPSKWIKTDSTFPWNVFVFETLLGKGLDHCIESCKAKRMCKFINFEVAADACSLVGANKTLGPMEFKKIIQAKAGHLFGNKSEWNLERYKSCSDCEPKGMCTNDTQPAMKYSVCQNSGCLPPEQKSFVVILGNLFSAGSKIKYQCEEGFTDVSGGTGQATCQEDGTWTQTDVKCLPANGFWIGASDAEDEGTFLWSDGTPVSAGYTNWGRTEPNGGNRENCMLFTWQHKWIDITCRDAFFSICEFR